MALTLNILDNLLKLAQNLLYTCSEVYHEITDKDDQSTLVCRAHFVFDLFKND